MKRIKLMRLTIQDFKGIAARNIDFAGHDAQISGRNGLGKTSVYDALCWLLIGKDARGNQPESEGFNIKPRDKAGNVRAGVMPTVTGVFEVDSEEITLKKLFKEKWEKPRGTSEAKFAGHTTDYFVDDIPRQEKEYRRIISELVSEEAFLLLTDVYRFPQAMKWQERRKLLFELCAVQDDKTIMAQDARFAPLVQAVGRWSVDEYKKAQQAQRRNVNGSLEMLPIRIDEVEKSAAALRGLDFEALEKQADELKMRHRELELQLYDITNNTAVMTAKNQLSSLKNQLAALENENNAHRRSQDIPAMDPRPEIERELAGVRARMRSLHTTIEAAETDLTMTDQRLDSYRSEWLTINKEKFTSGGCPTCGQKLPHEHLQAATDRFEADKKARQKRLKADSDLLKEGMERTRQQQANAKAELDTLAARETDLQDKLSRAQAPVAPVIEDLPDYAEQAVKLQADIQQAETQARQLESGDKAIETQVKAQIIDLDKQIHAISADLHQKEVLEASRRRVQELQADQRKLAAELDSIDAMIFLCEEFTRHKVSAITEAINGRFRLASFRLFREQINGGLDDCCDVMLNGTPYGSVSDGEKVKVGLDIIRTLSEFYGVRVPLFVDRAESVTDMPDAGTQMIQLVVRDMEMEIVT